MCHYVICGCTTKLKTHKPDDFARNVYCPHCSNNVDTVEIYQKTYCSFFFIPIFPVRTKKLYNGCEICKCKFSDGHVKCCDRCKNVILDDYRFCGRCGDQINFLG